MSALIIDTSIWIEYFHIGNTTVEEALKSGRVHLPPLVASELISGIKDKKHRLKMQDFLSDLAYCETSIEHWFRVGILRNDLRNKGFTISTPDAHICQCALDLDGILYSKDKIFAKIQKLVSLKLQSN